MTGFATTLVITEFLICSPGKDVLTPYYEKLYTKPHSDTSLFDHCCKCAKQRIERRGQAKDCRRPDRATCRHLSRPPCAVRVFGSDADRAKRQDPTPSRIRPGRSRTRNPVHGR